MQWYKLLQPFREIESTLSSKDNVRSPFLRDVDKIIFSSYFRKLQNKTQVHPLAKNSYVRTRLTHSLEVSSVARSLGHIVGEHVLQNNPNLNDDLKNNSLFNIKITNHDFGYILQAAALAHDIGNPPFGHIMETLISSFYSKLFSKLKNKQLQYPFNLPIIYNQYKELQKNAQETDFTNFDGNSQGLRIITTLAGKENTGGLNLTYPVLATFCKYPNSIIDKNYISAKKIGVFSTEQYLFTKISSSLGITKINNKYTARHPLTFLLESADDICYLIADLLDALSMKVISIHSLIHLFTPIIINQKNLQLLPKGYDKQLSKRLNELNNYKESCHSSQYIPWLAIETAASDVINILIHAVANAFKHNEQCILEGKFNKTLLSSSYLEKNISAIRKFAEDEIYKSNEKRTQELKGISVAEYILNNMITVCFMLYVSDNADLQTKTKCDLINQIFLKNKLTKKKSLFENLQTVNDFIVGCTDAQLVDISTTIPSVL